MKQTEITVSKKAVNYAIGSVIFVILLALSIKFPLSGSDAASIEDSDLAAGSPEKFALLSGQGGERSVGST